jgi:glucose-6-phosphate 1-dehydrogenase
MDLSKPDDYARLAETLQARNADTVVMYVATAPTLFTTVCEQIAAVGLNTPTRAWCWKSRWATTWQSNRAINHTVRRSSRKAGVPHRPLPGQARGAEPVCAAFWQCLFEPCGAANTLPTSRSRSPKSWASRKRGAFYETTGALRDMVQNHALQLLCAIGMEPPINSTPMPSATKSSRCCARSSPGHAEALAKT